MELPKSGQPVPLDELMELARYHEKFDIVHMLEMSPPESVFVSDGCSMWPDHWFGKDIYEACFWHDVRYWCGIPGDEVARLIADAMLAVDVAILASPDLARLMFTGVGFGGICGQSCSITSPWKKLYIFSSEKLMMDFVRNVEKDTVRRNSRIAAVFYPSPEADDIHVVVGGSSNR